MAFDPAPPSQFRKRIEQPAWTGRAPFAASFANVNSDSLNLTASLCSSFVAVCQ